ncbi:MAG: HAMP domain-containing histidine kinase [Oscillospiraceae bacterium]|nr:HAMP domain-containing histidine kinase [Oscillospiraceae bacterium]
MIRSLQVRFVIVALISMLAVLTLIIAGINIVNYNSTIGSADKILTLLSEHRGRFPKDEPHFGGAFSPEMSAELPYETRYFSVMLKNSGSIIQVETGNIASIDTSDAIDLARSVLDAQNERGFAQNYRYLVTSHKGTSHIIFLDCASRFQAFYSFLITSCIISIAGFILVGILITVTSARILRPIAESYEKQKRFITDAGHEIKTPLTIINADADVLEMDYGRNEWLDDIKTQAKRLTELTNDLVYLARMEEADNSIRMIEFPLSDVVREAVGSFNAPAQTHGKQLSCEVQPMLTLRGDERSIQQLVSILMDNAIKYSDEGGKINVKLEKQGKNIRLTVSNTTAAKLSPDNIERMFDRFYRGDPSRSSEKNGYGIGLSIAKAIVNTHGGRISARISGRKELTITALFPQ